MKFALNTCAAGNEYNSYFNMVAHTKSNTTRTLRADSSTFIGVENGYIGT